MGGQFGPRNGISIQQQMGRTSVDVRLALVLLIFSAFSCISIDAYALFCFRGLAQRNSRASDNGLKCTIIR